MTDVDLRLLVPRDLRLIVGDDEVVYLPGEIPLVAAMRVEQIRGDLWAAARERQLADNREEEAEARKLIAEGYQRAADEIHKLALERDPKVEPLELTVTQIDTILQMLVAPVERETLMAHAYSVALGIQEPELDPLGGGSSASSPPSDEPQDSPARTGGRSRGASGSRSAKPRGGSN